MKGKGGVLLGQPAPGELGKASERCQRQQSWCRISKLNRKTEETVKRRIRLSLEMFTECRLVLVRTTAGSEGGPGTHTLERAPFQCSTPLSFHPCDDPLSWAPPLPALQGTKLKPRASDLPKAAGRGAPEAPFKPGSLLPEPVFLTITLPG